MVGDARLPTEAVAAVIADLGHVVECIAVGRASDTPTVVDVAVLVAANPGVARDLLGSSRRGAGRRVVIVARAPSPGWPAVAAELGVATWLPADSCMADLDAALDPHHADDGRVTVVVRETTRPDPLERLSPREREVLSTASLGASPAEIAEQLGISRHTVRKHLSNILEKLGVSSRLQAVSIAVGAFAAQGPSSST